MELDLWSASAKTALALLRYVNNSRFEINSVPTEYYPYFVAVHHFLENHYQC